MTTAFDIRCIESVDFDIEIFEILRHDPRVIAVCANGTEHTHSDFVSLLHCNFSDAAKFVRFAPDGVFLTTCREVIHYDSKASKYIEKDAYETYLKYKQCGCRVLLFVKHENRIFVQDVERIRLLHGSVTVEPYSIERRWPVGEDGWIYPKLKKNFRASTNPGLASGTPYREIDLSSMLVFTK